MIFQTLPFRMDSVIWDGRLRSTRGRGGRPLGMTGEEAGPCMSRGPQRAEEAAKCKPHLDGFSEAGVLPPISFTQ